MVNTHIHITGEPLTRGYVPDDTPFEENVFEWLCPLYAASRAAEERTSAQLAAVEMLRVGHDDVPRGGHDPLPRRGDRRPVEVGIRGRVGRGCGTSRPSRPSTARPPTRRSAASSGSSTPTPRRTPTAGRGTWAILVGHTTCSDPLWQAATAAGRRARRRDELPHVAGHSSTPTAFIAEFGQRPMVHLDELGVLDRDVGDDPLRPRRRRARSTLHGRSTARQRRPLPDDRAQGQLRRDPDRQVPRDGAARASTSRSAPTATTRRTTPT